MTAYARDVLADKIPAGKLVKCACQRHMDDLKAGPKRGLSWHPKLAEFVFGVFGYLKHSKGEYGGKPFVLSPWQKFVVGSVFGWKRKDGTRRFRVVYEEVPRKNGKSTKLAAVGIYCLTADGEPGAEVYAAATRREQARIIFSEAQNMVRKSADLLDIVTVYRMNMNVPSTFSKFEPLSSDDRTLDGLNPHCVLVDELHAHKSRSLLDVLDTALGARRQPLLWEITTAGDDDPESVYTSEHEYARQVVTGAMSDDNLFVYIATIDEGDDWTDPKAWAKANPGLGVSVKFDDLKRQADKARRNPAAQAAFKRLRLNVRGGSANREIDMEVWRKNTEAPIDVAKLHGRTCYGGLDLASKIDIAAWVKIFPPAEGESRWQIVPRFWMPADSIIAREERDRVPFRRWAEEGWIETTEGNVIDHSEIQSAIADDAALFHVAGVAFDPWNATQLSVKLNEEGVPMHEFVQGFRSYNEPMKEFLAMLLQGRFEHGGNPVLTWMAANLKGITDKNENKMPSKKHSTARIDGISATIMAMGRALARDNDMIPDDYEVKSWGQTR